MHRIGDDERRTRLAARHCLAPTHKALTIEAATAAMVCLHATDHAAVYLSGWARVEGLSRDEVDRALYERRSLVKHLAMRRTLFVVPRESLAVVQAAASAQVAEDERRRLIRDATKAGLFADAEQWFIDASAAVLDTLAVGGEATWSELRAQIPLLAGAILQGEGKAWGGPMPVGPRVLASLSASGQVLRGSNLGGWTRSRPAFTLTESWLGHALEPIGERAARAALVRQWLDAFGPGTAQDIKWWLGSTLTLVRQALADIDAAEVALEGGSTGYVLPDDLDRSGPVEPWVALLPMMDPTTMGWYGRDWYLGSHRPLLFDTAGNASPTAWCDGRIVGGWRQAESGEVLVDLLEDVGREAGARLDEEAARLTAWFGGVRVLPRFPSPLYRSRREP